MGAFDVLLHRLYSGSVSWSTVVWQQQCKDTLDVALGVVLLADMLLAPADIAGEVAQLLRASVRSAKDQHWLRAAVLGLQLPAEFAELTGFEEPCSLCDISDSTLTDLLPGAYGMRRCDTLDSASLARKSVTFLLKKRRRHGLGAANMKIFASSCKEPSFVLRQDGLVWFWSELEAEVLCDYSQCSLANEILASFLKNYNLLMPSALSLKAWINWCARSTGGC